MLKQEIKKINDSIPVYLTGFIFLMFVVVFLLESKVYSYFGGTLNFITTSSLFTLFICVTYFYLSQRKIKRKEKLSKTIGLKLYRLMKLENE